MVCFIMKLLMFLVVAVVGFLKRHPPGAVHDLRHFLVGHLLWSAVILIAAMVSSALTLSRHHGRRLALFLAACVFSFGTLLGYLAGVPSTQDRSAWLIFCLFPVVAGVCGVVEYLRADYSWETPAADGGHSARTAITPLVDKPGKESGMP